MPLVTLQQQPRGLRWADIVIVPAIDAEHHSVERKLFKPGVSGQETIYSKITNARVLIYNFTGVLPTRAAAFESYAYDLLDSLKSLRNTDSGETLDALFRPIHFVGYSTGGLIVKSALILANRAPLQGFAPIAAACSSVAFYGVPHRGSSIMSEAPFAKSIQECLSLRDVKGMNAVARAMLDPESPDLAALARAFAPIARKLNRIWTFVETQPWRLEVLATDSPQGPRATVTFPVVDPRSAELRIGNEVRLALSGTHADLLNFRVNSKAVEIYLDDLVKLLSSASAVEDDFEAQLKRDVLVDLHLFYNSGEDKGQDSPKLWSVSPNYASLLEDGLMKCLEAKYRLLESPRVPLPPEIAGAFPDEKVPLITGPVQSQGARNIITPPAVQAGDDLPSVNGAWGGDKPEIPTIIITSADDVEEEVVQVKSRTRRASAPSVTPTARPPQYSAVPHDLSQQNQSSLLSPNLFKFQLPNPSRHRFRWIQLPCNNLPWVPDLMRCVAREPATAMLEETLLHENNLYAKQRVARHGLPHSRQMMPDAKFFPPPAAAAYDEAGQIAIFLPYLHWDDLTSLLRRTELIDLRLRPSTSSVQQHIMKKSKSVESRLTWQYISSTGDAPYHCRRSLDSYGYPSLKSLKARDRDQVLYKQRAGGAGLEVLSQLPNSKDAHSGRAETASGSKIVEDDGKVLMVDQLWCWVVNKATVMTCFSPKEEETTDKAFWRVADLRDTIFNDINGDPQFASQCDDVFDLAALIVYHAVSVFLDTVGDEDLQVFRIFEEYVGSLTEKHTTSFKAFRDRYSAKGAYSGLKNSPNAAGETLSSIQDSDLKSSAEDLTSLLELRDVEDELNTLDKLFRDQIAVVQALQNQFSVNLVPRGNGIFGAGFLENALARLQSYRANVESIKFNCSSTEAAFTRLLDMKQKQANVAEAWAAREANQVASGQSRSVMIFTIFTIIFLPLSFFTSLFGMNASDWSGLNTDPDLHVILAWTFPISLAVIIVALLVAFNQSVRAMTFRMTRQAMAIWRKRHHEESDLEKEGINTLGVRDATISRTGAIYRGVTAAGNVGAMMGGQNVFAPGNKRPVKSD